MNIIEKMVRQRYWFLPTKKESEIYREERKESFRKEYPEVMGKMIRLGEEVAKITKKLEETFSEEQYGLWIELKKLSQKEVFEASRLRLFDEELAKDNPLFN